MNSASKREQSVYRRVVRRETHSARTTAAAVLATVLVVLLVAALALGVWWLVAPGARGELADRLSQVTSRADDGGTLVAVGVLALLVGLALVLAAVLPGRLRRRARRTDRVALVVDDGVLADAVVAAVAVRCGLDRRQISASVGRRRTTVRLTPTSGVPVDRQAAADTAAAVLDRVGFPAPQRLLVADQGVIS
ncbi:hypothetical protein [Promicromonospora sukumoe]|uniref:Uncharacterized protein n=1 Tax=Promicromonospora sukumoe TaxID=88382 RepID=A0A7W3J5P2_9MICO|nr:hypothetical protein [Promicromonospora sukumoe]MBA8806690.1 hypothetical protein [Promicromonospora sukumoe]